MRAAVICAVLIASALSGTRADASLRENGEEDGAPAEVMPWVFKTDVSAFAYGRTPHSDPTRDYQWKGVQSFTLQANRYLWLNGDLQTQETQAPGFTRPYRDWASAKLAAVAQVLPNRLYLLAGGSYALGATTLPLADSVSLSEALNGYSPLPDPQFLSVPCGFIGTSLRWEAWGGESILGANYYRPGQVSPFDTLAFYPASFFSLEIQYRRRGEGPEHVARLRGFLFTEEENGERFAAHVEAPALQFAYLLNGVGTQRTWDLEWGAALKGTDRNRRVRLRVNPPEASVNDNLQRLWAASRWHPVRSPWWLGAKGQALWNAQGPEIGYEAVGEMGWRRSAWGSHLATVKLEASTALFAGETYWGAGVDVAFAFRHLGLDASRPDIAR